MSIRKHIPEANGSLMVNLICLTVAILVKSALFLHFFTFDDDKLFQAVAAKNLAEGKGLAYYEVNAGNLDKELKIPLNRWPPGYSIAIATIYKFAGDLITSVLLLDVIFIVAFFVVFRKILERLQIPNYLINILILFNGFTITPYIGMPTDLHAVVFILIGILLALRFNELKATQFGVLIGLFSFLSSFFRYMYLPGSFVIGVSMLLIGLISKNKNVLKGAVYCLLTTFFLTAGLLLFNTYYSGSSAYVMPMEKGFYPENILKLYPFIYAAFLNLNFIITQLELNSPYSYSFWYSIFVYLNIITCVFLVIWVFARRHRFTKFKSNSLFIISTSGIIIAALLLTGYLSVTNGLYKITLKPSGPWTFIGDGRYFAFAIIILPVLLLYYIYPRMAEKKFAIVKYIFVSLVVFNLFHTARFLIRKSSFTSAIVNATMPHPVKQYLESRINQSKHNNINVVLTGDRETIANWGYLHGTKALLNSDELIKKLPASKKVSMLLLVNYRIDPSFYAPFFDRANVKRDTVIAGYSVYSYLTGQNAQ